MFNILLIKRKKTDFTFWKDSVFSNIFNLKTVIRFIISLMQVKNTNMYENLLNINIYTMKNKGFKIKK